MFSVCKQTHPATGIEHAISCHFFNKTERNLVLAGANVLKVFRLIPDIDPKSKEKISEIYPPKSKLECMAQFSLYGNIMAMESVNLASSPRDALLLSYADAKLSVLEYDPDTHDLRTLSLHYFEDEEIKDGWTHHHHMSIIRADPENRCAVMTVFGRKLVVLPFRRDTSIEDTDTDVKPMTQGAYGSKAPILSSYMINLKELMDKIDNVIDIQFLHGYYEPTLLILYEPLKTFSGFHMKLGKFESQLLTVITDIAIDIKTRKIRCYLGSVISRIDTSKRVAVRTDTCAMAAISLNLQQKVHPVIWSVSNLPFDCTKALPIKKPLGGTLILSVNALIYLNQSIPPYGVSLNSIAETCTNFPLKPQEGIKISLDCAQSGFLEDDTLVLSLKNGDLYVLTLLADSMRYVRSFHFHLAASSVLTTCLCVCEHNFLFLGSRLGNSLLLRFQEKCNEVIVLDDSEEPSSKRAKTGEGDDSDKVLDSLTDCIASDVQDIRDPEEFEVYGNQQEASLHIRSYAFEVCDSLLNIGPCGNLTLGEPAFLSEEFSNRVNIDLEIATTSGYGKNGALCILQRSIRPQVVTTYTLPGCFNVWTVCNGGDRHAFLLLGREEDTLVLQTGQEIDEISNSGFAVDCPSVYAGNLGHNKYIVQVTTASVRLLKGPVQIQHIPLNLGSAVVFATSADPYISLLTTDGQVITFMLRESKQTGVAKLVISKSTLSNVPPVTSICLYKDLSGLFCNKIPEEFTFIPQIFVAESDVKPDVENEDDLLYGDNSDFKMPSLNPPPPKPRVRHNWWKKYLMEYKKTYWLFVIRDYCHLELYSVPNFKLCYYVANICHGPKVLVDNLESVLPGSNTNLHSGVDHRVRELLVAPLGNKGSRPLLFIRMERDIYIYEVFRFPRGNLKLRFRKVKHDIIYEGNTNVLQDSDNSDWFYLHENIPKMRYFNNVAGYNGVFICGVNPQWIFLPLRGELRIHPMGIDGELHCFAPFNNLNCQYGFLYINKKDELRIGLLPVNLSYDAPWPVRKVPLRCTPHFVTYHLESKTYCLVTSIAEPSNKYYKFNGEDKELSVEDKGDRFPYPPQEIFSIMLFSPVSWDIIPSTKIDLDEWEHVNCLKNVSLAYEGTRSGLRGYIALGTNYNYGEDITSRGRILIYDIIEVVPEPGQPLTKNRFKEIYAKEQKGPVTALSQVSGFLVSAVGQKIYIWQLTDNDLVGVAFIDTQVYTHQILAIKNLLLIADVYKSIALLRFQEEHRTLSLVSRDFKPCEVYAIEYLIDGSSMGFLVSDREKNLVLYMYQPEARESLGGQRLLRKADFHLGQAVNTFFRIACKMLEIDEDTKTFSSGDRRHISMYATLDGGMGYLMPLPEKTYRRLLMLQNVLVTHGAHIAGLNPKAFRTYKSYRKLQANPSRSIIDGELVWSFLNLALTEKVEVSKKIGTKIDELLDDLGELQKLTSHF